MTCVVPLEEPENSLGHSVSNKREGVVEGKATGEGSPVLQEWGELGRYNGGERVKHCSVREGGWRSSISLDLAVIKGFCGCFLCLWA